MEIYFVRHAEKGKESEDPALTERGAKQAVYLSERLEKIKFTKFFSSDTLRTKQTSKYISDKMGMEPSINSCLNEFSVSLLKTSEGEWNEEERKRYKELQEFLKDLVKNSEKDEKILIIAHGVTNRLIMANLLDLNMKNIVRMAQLETAVNIVYWVEKFDNWRLHSWNDNSHLPEDLKMSLDGY